MELRTAAADMSMSQVLYGPVSAADLFASQQALVHPYWSLEPLGSQPPVPRPLSPPRSRHRSSTISSSEPLQPRRPPAPRRGIRSPVMNGPDDDSPVSGSAATSGLYLDVAIHAPRSVKRPRPVKSCLECRKRKLKCDRALTCSQCQKSHRACRYSFDGQNGAGSDGDSDVEAERAPKRVQGSGTFDAPAPPPAAPGGGGGYVGAARAPPNPAEMDEMASRLERLEKLLMDKQSHGDHSSPASARLMAHQLRLPSSPVTIRSLTVKTGARTRFFGQNSPKVLLNLFDDAKDFMRTMPQAEGFKETFTGLQNVYRALQLEHRKGMEPINSFVDPSTPIQHRMANMLPDKSLCDHLLEVYFATCEGLYRVVHIPSVRREYDHYWADGNCNDSFLPRLICMLAIASRFDAGSKMLPAEPPKSVHVPTAYAVVRSWVDSLRGKQLVDIHTLQTELLLLQTQRLIAPRHQDAWTQLGFIVRMAMTMGLHRDPSEFPKLTAFSGEMRRRLWYSIMDMDLSVSLDCNLPCAVREGEHSCGPPRNLDDQQIDPETQVLPDPNPMDQVTSGQMQAYTASTLPWRTKVANILGRLDSIRDYAEVLDIGIKLERMLDDVSYLFPRRHSPDPQQRFQDWRLRFYLDFHIRKALLALYRPFAMGTPNCPSQISTAYLKSSMAVLAYVQELDSQIPAYKDVLYRFQMLLRQDIIQAAFSLCYFIKGARDTAPNSRPNGQWMPNLSPALSESSIQIPTEARPIWSTSALVKSVEHALDMLITVVQDNKSDLREILALTIVLNTVQSLSAEQKREQIKAGVKSIFERLVETLNAQSTAGGTNGSSASTGSVTPIYTGAQQKAQAGADLFDVAVPMSMHFISDDFFQTNMSDDFLVWDNFLEYWNPADIPTERT